MDDYSTKILFTSISSIINISFCLFKESLCFGLMITLLFPISLAYSFGYFYYKNSVKSNFFILLCFVIFITLCISYSANLFTSYIL